MAAPLGGGRIALGVALPVLMACLLLVLLYARAGAELFAALSSALLRPAGSDSSPAAPAVAARPTARSAARPAISDSRSTTPAVAARPPATTALSAAASQSLPPSSSTSTSSHGASKEEDGWILHIAGLEGTGHHFYDDLAIKICRRKPRCVVGVKWDFGIRPPRQMSRSEWIEQTAKTLGSRYRKTSGGGGEPGKPWVPAIMKLDDGSFPQGSGLSHARRQSNHPNETYLVEVAGRAAVGVRILVLLRFPVDDLLSADCVRRDMETCEPMARTLAHNARELISQMKAIGPEKYRCVRYGEVDNMARGWAWAMAEPYETVLADIKSIWKPWGSEERRPSDSEIVKLAKMHLSQPVSELEAMCKHK